MYKHGRLTLVDKLKLNVYTYMYTHGRLTLVNELKLKFIYTCTHMAA